MSKQRIGIMGGTFNPIHTGHIRMACQARLAAQLDQVLVIPTGNPPHKTGIAPAEDRWRMVCAACTRYPELSPSRVEIDRQGVIYTVDTLSILRQEYPKAHFFYIIGDDTLMELHTWRRYEDVLKQCTFLVCPRDCTHTAEALDAERRRLTELGGSFQTVSAPMVNVSSTDLRAALDDEEDTPLLPAPVREYCAVKGLYGMDKRFSQGDRWLDLLWRDLTVKRFAHSLSVAYTARRLALMHGLDAYKAELAGLLHDCAKCLPHKQMEELARKQQLTTDDGILSSNALLHALTGAYLTEHEYGVHDPDVLHAIASHTTGKPGMTLLDMAVYLADKIEPTRESYPLLETVRSVAQTSLTQAMIASMEGTASHVRKGGKPLHPATLATLQWFTGSRNGAD